MTKTISTIPLNNEPGLSDRIPYNNGAAGADRGLELLYFERRYRYAVNVKEFGAKGDGLTNDHAAIQEAFDSINSIIGGIIFFPDGNYLVNSTILIEGKSNIIVTAQLGAQLTVNGESVFVLRFEGPLGMSGARPKNVIVENLTIYDPDPIGNTGNEESHGVRFSGYDNIEVRNCVINQVGDEGIEFTRCRWARAYNNYGIDCPFVDPGQPAFIQVSASRHARVENNFSNGTVKGPAFGFRTPSGSGNQSEDVIFRGNISLNADTYGISIIASQDDVKGIKCYDNWIINPRNVAIRYFNFGGYVIEEADIHRNRVIGGGEDANIAPARRGAIEINSLTAGAKIRDNRIFDWGLSGELHHVGIHVLADDCELSNNRISGTPGSGIYLNANGVVSETDKASNTGTHGIQIAGGTGNQVINPQTRYNKLSGVELSSGVEGNTVRGGKSHGNSNGVQLRGDNKVEHVDARGNTSSGIRIASGSGAIVRFNDVRDNPSAIDTGASSDSERYKNKGYVSEARGTVTIPSGGTGFTVQNSGLSGNLPPIEGIIAIPTSSLGNASYFWVTRENNSWFRINLDVDPGQDVNFSWNVKMNA